MNIPLNNLYDYIKNTAEKLYDQPLAIYRFYPNGSKNIDDLEAYEDYNWYETITRPVLYCNDQEPLNYNYYAQTPKTYTNNDYMKILAKYNLIAQQSNLDYVVNAHKHNFLIHSESRSNNLEKYQIYDRLIGVYYWCHAIIARDWFRYAQHVDFFSKHPEKLFLIYNRAWTGTREYRLKFSDLLIEHGLVDQCLTFCNPVEDSQHYRDYDFANASWRPKHVLEHYFLPSMARSSASADFSTRDYQSTEIEVVLETLFDDDRLHLTEKSLRPIACRQPFILAATHGSLQYLRDYGFRTFDQVWDESYDKIVDPHARMLAIIDLMKSIRNWTSQQRHEKIHLLHEIVSHNQRYFFSESFFDLVQEELRENLNHAFLQVEPDQYCKQWWSKWQERLKYNEIQEFLNTNKNLKLPTREQYDMLVKFFSKSA